MNELKGKHANVVLCINEGQGFDILKCPFYMTANYNGRIIESNVSEPMARVTFNTEIVWETEKKLLRKARCGYTAIRLECFTTERRFVGFAMVRLRSAKIIGESSADQAVKNIWMKLLNVPSEWRKGAIQVNLSLTIRDAVVPVANTTEEPQDSPAPIVPAVQLDHIRIPVKLTEDGYVQLGAESEKYDKFQIKLTSLQANDMDILLNADLLSSQGDHVYYLTYTVFGMNIKTRRFSRDLRQTVPLHESIIINLLTTFSTLTSFFKRNPIIKVKFFCNNLLLGWSGINICEMLDAVDYDLFYGFMQGKFSLDQEVVFESELFKAAEDSCQRTPILQAICTVELIEKILRSPKLLALQEAEDRKWQMAKEARESLLKANRVCNPEEESSAGGVQEYEDVGRSLEPNEPILEELSEVAEASTPDEQTELALNDPHQVFCLNIILEVIIWNQEPTCKRIGIHFMHPKGKGQLRMFVDVNTMHDTCMLLENIICKLFYTSTKLRINDLLVDNKPIIELHDGETQALLAGPLSLDTSKLCSDTMEYNYLVPLNATNGKEVAQISICLLLEEAEMPKYPNLQHDLLPEIIDDAILCSSFEEHEQWIRKQRQIFTAGLERTREAEMNKLKVEFQEKQEELVDAMTADLEKSKQVLNELKVGTETPLVDELEQRRLIDKDYDIYLEIHQNLVRYALTGNDELIEKISELELDNSILRDLFTDQHMELRDLRKSRLTPEQVKTLLQDLHAIETKVDQAMKDKKYFKTGYERAVHEVHALKVERQKFIADKIAHDKETFVKLNLDKLSAFTNSLNKKPPPDDQLPCCSKSLLPNADIEEVTEEEEFVEAHEEFEDDDNESVDMMGAAREGGKAV